MLTVRSALPDLKAREAILRVAMALFAAEGPERVTIRAIGAEAGVSPALVIHHFGSRQGLRDAVQARVVAQVEEMLTTFLSPELFAADAADGETVPRGATMAEMVAGAAAEDPAVFAYLRRLLVEGGDAADTVFAAMFEATRRALGTLEAAGLLREAADPDARAAFLLVNDLGALLLQERLVQVVGVDPLRGPGARRWADAVLAVYGIGIYANGQARAPRGSAR
jgi:AcrR family transcriptional regulator